MVVSGSSNSCKTLDSSHIQFSPQNPSFCMVSLDVNYFLKYIFHCGYNLSNFQDPTSDRIQDVLSSCKSPVSKLGLKSVYLIESPNCEVFYPKDYLCLKESYLSHSFEDNQLLIFLENVLMLIFFFIAPKILLSVSGCMDYSSSLISP